MTDTVTGWALFMAEAPLVGLDPHPGSAPNLEDGAPATAADWAAAYNVVPSRAEAETEAREDQAAWEDAVADGDLEDAMDADIALMVRVHADGRMDVMTDAGDLLASYSAAEICAAYGMPAP